MRNTIVSNGWNTTEWGLAFLRVSSFPIDPSCTFDTEEEFQNYLQGNDTDKPYLGQLISVQSDKYHVYVVQEYNGTEWTARPLNEDEIAELGDKINELKEKVDQDLADLEQKLKGDHLTEDYDTLSKIQDIILQHKAVAAQFFSNFQTELDQTQTGIGLSQDGSFSPDQETHYLKNATSVMNALRTLDKILYRLKYAMGESSTAYLEETLDRDTDITTITPHVKIANDSDIEVREGLYLKVQTEYDKGILTLKINGNTVATHDLGLSGLVEDSYYDSQNEKIVIIFKLHNGESQRVEIPAGEIIEEWIVNNPDTSPVQLTKTRVVDGKDTLSADVRLSNKPNNILVKDGNTLYVKGTANNITFEDSTVEDELNRKVDKASGLKADYNAANYEDTPYYSTDTKEILLNGDNYGGGVQSITQKTLDTNYTPDTADVYEVRSNTEVDELQLTFTPLSPLSLTVPETIGDITRGTTSQSLKGKPISEILDSILFKTIYPSITDPSVTIGASTATVEAGSILVTEFTNTFNRGSVVVNDGVTANKSYVGTATSTVYQVKVTGGTANTNAGVSAYPNANDAVYTTVTRYEPGTYQYKVVVSYGIGPTMTTSKGASPNPMPTTNKGNVTNPHPAGSVSSSYGLVRNVTLPVFIDVANGTYTKQALRNWGAMTYTGVAMQDTTRSNPIRIKTPRKLQSVNSYNAVSGKYDVPQLTNFVMSTVTNSTNGKDYTYYEYVWNGGAMSAVNMEIKTY